MVEEFSNAYGTVGAKHEKVALFQIENGFLDAYNKIKGCAVRLIQEAEEMNDYNAEGNYYTIGHVAMFTGFTDRTVRSYIASGLLCGEKINGVWHFTPEQVQTFVSHPSVYPGILSKNNAIVYDFLSDTQKKESECCVILDIPNAKEKQTAEYFCHEICAGQFSGLRFSFNSIKGVPRVILRGATDEVMTLVNRWREQRK